MERQKFEDSFKDAFKDAEYAPSDSVWTNVELDIEKSSGGKMKKKLVFFQLLAAASMVFAMGVGAVYFLNTNSSGDAIMAQQNDFAKDSDTNARDKKNELVVDGKQDDATLKNLTNNSESTDGQHRVASKADNSPSEKDILNSTKNFNHGIRSVNNNSSVTADNSTAFIAHTDISEKENNFDTGRSAKEVLSDRKPSSRLIDFDRPALVLPVSEPDPGMLLLARLEDEEKKFNKDEKPKIKERTWASIGVGAGSFNPSTSTPQAQRGAAGITTGNGTTTASSNPTAGTSYSVGVSMAGKVSRRVVLQGGLSYLSQNAEFTSSSAIGQNASLNELAASSDALVPTSPYKVNSNLQYLSVPMQAGYVVLDRGFGIQVNGGFSTDLFLQNTLTPEDKSLGKVSQGAGSDSPYRTINFSGLVGTEFSYKVADQYRIAVSPGLRYALNSIYKSEVDTQLSPLTFDVALRFRYIFR